MLLLRMPGYVVAVGNELQITLPSQVRNEFLVRVRLSPAELVIEMNNRRDDPQFAAQLQQQPQQRDRIDATRDGNANPISGLQKLFPPNVVKHAFRQRMHATMVQPGFEDCVDYRCLAPQREKSKL